MRAMFGKTTVTTFGTRVQLSSAAWRVKRIQFQVPAANTGRMFLGLSDVSATVNSWEFQIPSATRTKEKLELDFGEGSESLSVFYVDSTVSGESIDWVAILR